MSSAVGKCRRRYLASFRMLSGISGVIQIFLRNAQVCMTLRLRSYGKVIFISCAFQEIGFAKNILAICK
jgi:hypothetical protein